MRLNTIAIVALVLTIIGALNWGLVGLFQFDLVAALLGPMSMATRAVYVLVGIAGIVLAVCAFARTPAVITTRPRGVSDLR